LVKQEKLIKTRKFGKDRKIRNFCQLSKNWVHIKTVGKDGRIGKQIHFLTIEKLVNILLFVKILLLVKIILLVKILLLVKN